jgi:peroxiredoxin
MKKSWHRLLGYGFLVILLGVNGCSWLSSSGSRLGSEMNMPAPSFSVPTVDGKTASLKDYSGKVLVVNFWATWCGPCREEIPEFSALASAYRSKGVEFLGISMDDGEASEVKELVQTFGHQYRVEYTLAVGDDAVANAFGGVNSLPTTFVIDRAGKIVKKYNGYAPALTDDIQQTIQKLAG